MNIVETAAVPIDLRNSEVVFGAAEYVFFEVFTHWMLMYFFKFEKRSFVELAAIHTVSLPFIGGLGAFVEFPHDVAGAAAAGPARPWRPSCAASAAARRTSKGGAFAPSPSIPRFR